MANNERLTKRVKKIEEWLEENGSGPTLNNFNFLLDAVRNAQGMNENTSRQLEGLQRLNHEFLEMKELGDEWNKWLEEKNNAVQEQQTEEVSVQEEAKSGEEAIEAQKEEEE